MTWVAYGQEQVSGPCMGLVTLIGFGNLDPVEELNPQAGVIQQHYIGIAPVDAVICRSDSPLPPDEVVGGATKQIQANPGPVAPGAEFPGNAGWKNAGNKSVPHLYWGLGVKAKTPPFTPTTWSPTDVTAGVALSNGNKTATMNNATYEGARSTATVNMGGGARKLYVECLTGATAGGDCCFGLLKKSDPMLSGENMLGGANTYATWRNSGSNIIAAVVNSNAIAIPWGAAGVRLCLAIDEAANKVWVRLGAGPQWGAPGGNPEDGSTPTWFNFPAGEYALVMATDNNAGLDELGLPGDVIHPIPAGYSASL